MISGQGSHDFDLRVLNNLIGLHSPVMSRQTPTSRRSPSILVTDVRHSRAHSAPFVSRRLNSLSVDSILSNTSEVPSAYRRPAGSTSNYRTSTHRSPIARRRGPENVPLLDPPASLSPSKSPTYGALSEPRSEARAGTPQPSPLGKQVKPVPQLSKPLPSRTSKQSQRLVLIPDSNEIKTGTGSESRQESSADNQDTMRVTSYLISEGILLRKVAHYLKTKHRARVRLYDEALFADYLLPLLPGNGVDYRIQSSRGDDRSMERMIDISEQRDHHYEYFSAFEAPEDNPSEPQDFSPRPNADAPINSQRDRGHAGSPGTEGEEEDRQNLANIKKLDHFTSHAELFVFNYGVLVFWNFKEAQEKQILADLCLGNDDLVIKSYNDQEIQSEELKFTYDLGETDKPRIFNDIIYLSNNSHMLKLAMSHAMAQSTILCGFEDHMQTNLKDVRTVPKTLALTGKLGMNREQLLKISGRLYKLRVDVNLSSNVLDIPEFFWDSEPSLFPLFNALREYLEIDERVLVLNERQSVFLELASILGDSIAEFNMDRITVIMIGLIGLSICVSLMEIFVRFLVLRKAQE